MKSPLESNNNKYKKKRKRTQDGNYGMAQHFRNPSAKFRLVDIPNMDMNKPTTHNTIQKKKKNTHVNNK
jgi:hypothetical protein